MTATDAMILMLVLSAILGIIAIGLGIAWDRACTRATDAADQRDATAADLTGALNRLDEVIAECAGERANALRLLGLLNQARAENEAVALTQPAAPMLSEIRALFAEADAIVRGAEGGEQR